ncbi:Ser/Thr protein kinase RdoA (MazF antagonist) [Scopulibacillus darangshiensis]|uniref:Ser/Thr protein kinase RdoA (MazF antagonist) n=1 Tax=Scopulibacillus darangshiensis TaxID=442528 RepID=A0A4R2NR45_9BACL|nr:aminoglycoside phosphotransferase family protein [Scopulibacillus darangshiensis]TCP23805.1 Ser/Thr protein kinase RdoA (MazF antagonist) [Scopulibacillus darangshiensis]
MILADIQSWDDWRDVFTDVSFWRPYIDRICKKEGLKFKNIEGSLPGTSAVFILDRSMVIKIYPSVLIDDDQIERAALGLVKEKDEILIASGSYETEGSLWPYIIMTYIEGEPYGAARQTMTAQEKTAFLRKAAGWLKGVHNIKTDHLPSIERGILNWRSHRATALLQIKRRINQLPFLAAHKIWPDLCDFLNKQLPLLDAMPVNLVHGDLTEDHFLFSEGKTLRAVIDWGDARAAPYLYDLVTFWFSVLKQNGEDLDTFLKAYNEDLLNSDDLLPRLTALTFLHPFCPEIMKELWEHQMRDQAFSDFPSLCRWLWPVS